MKSFVAAGVVASLWIAPSAAEKTCADYNSDCANCTAATLADKSKCAWCSTGCIAAVDEAAKNCVKDGTKCPACKDKPCSDCGGITGCFFCAENAEGMNGSCSDLNCTDPSILIPHDKCPTVEPKNCTECVDGGKVVRAEFKLSVIDNFCVEKENCTAVPDMPVGTVKCIAKTADCATLPIQKLGGGYVYDGKSCFGVHHCGECVVKTEDNSDAVEADPIKCVWASRNSSKPEDVSTGCIPDGFVNTTVEGMIIFKDEDSCMAAPTQSPDNDGRRLTGALMVAAAATAFAVLF